MQWFFATEAPETPEELRTMLITNRALDGGITFEERCAQFENHYAARDLTCPCCEAGGKCETCTHALRWDEWERDRAELADELPKGEEVLPRGRAGSWHHRSCDVYSTHWALARRQVPLNVIK